MSKLLGVSEIVATGALKSHYLYTGFIFKNGLTPSSTGQGEDFSRIKIKRDYDHSVRNHSAQLFHWEPVAGPHCTLLVHQNCAGLSENKRAKKGQAIIIWIQVSENTVLSVHSW